MEEEICGRVVYHYREEEGEEEDPPRFASSCGKSDRDFKMCVCVYVREEEEEEEIYIERERDSRRRNFDRFHGEKVYCSRVVNRS